MGPDISIDYTSILHKKLYKNVIVAGTGQKDQSGVKSGAYTLYGIVIVWKRDATM